MSRPLCRLAFGLLFALAAAPLLAGTVYQWKDVNGVTHYSDAPPPKGSYRDREVDGEPPASATEATRVAADNAQCAQARLNLTRLEGDAAIGLDADRDGKPDAPLSAEDRARQLELARNVIQKYCPAGD